MTATVREKVMEGAKGSDRFHTPAHALTPLLPHLQPGWRVCEPSCGAGTLAAAIRAAGFAVTVAVDADQGFDFVTDDLFAPSMPAFDAILTNPPYSIKDAYLERCYEIGKPFALLLPITALGGSRRQRMYAEHGVEIILLGGRINFLTPSGKGSGSWFECAWFTHGLEIGRQITFSTLCAAARKGAEVAL